MASDVMGANFDVGGTISVVQCMRLVHGQYTLIIITSKYNVTDIITALLLRFYIVSKCSKALLSDTGGIIKIHRFIL